MAAHEKCLKHFAQPQHILLGPICSGKIQLTCQPFSQQPLQQVRKARKHHAVRCAAAASKDAVKQAMPQDVSTWAQSIGIESSGLRVAEFAGNISAAHCQMPVPVPSLQNLAAAHQASDLP